MTLLLIVQSAAFFLLSGLHFYWAFGGTWGFADALPTTRTGEKILNPKWFHSAFVGIFLAFFGAFYLSFLFTPNNIPIWISEWIGWFIGAIFTLRAIGDFKYVGFFKKVKSTSFGKRDTTLYSPLCLFLGIIALVLAWQY